MSELSGHSIGQGYICCGDELVTLSGLPTQRPRQDGSQSILFYPLRQTYSMANRHLSLHQSSGWKTAMMASDPSGCSSYRLPAGYLQPWISSVYNSSECVQRVHVGKKCNRRLSEKDAVQPITPCAYLKGGNPGKHVALPINCAPKQVET